MSQRIQFSLLLIIFLFVVANLIWEHTHGGVVSHMLLHREDLPSFSNWWGLLTVPIICYFLLGMVSSRLSSSDDPSTEQQRVLTYFIIGLIYGVGVSVSFTMGSEVIPLYFMIGFLVLSLFLPLYRPESFLGIILGMFLTFGSVIPILMGALLIVVSLIIYQIRRGVLYLIRQIGS